MFLLCTSVSPSMKAHFYVFTGEDKIDYKHILFYSILLSEMWICNYSNYISMCSTNLSPLVWFLHIWACLMIHSCNFHRCISDVIMWRFLYCMYDCNPQDVLFYCKYTKSSPGRPQIWLVIGSMCRSSWRKEAFLLQCEVKQRVYKASSLSPGAHKRDLSQRRGGLTMRTSVGLLVLLAVASHTVASEYRELDVR